MVLAGVRGVVGVDSSHDAHRDFCLGIGAVYGQCWSFRSLASSAVVCPLGIGGVGLPLADDAVFGAADGHGNAVPELFVYFEGDFGAAVSGMWGEDMKGKLVAYLCGGFSVAALLGWVTSYASTLETAFNVGQRAVCGLCARRGAFHWTFVEAYSPIASTNSTVHEHVMSDGREAVWFELPGFRFPLVHDQHLTKRIGELSYFRRHRFGTHPLVKSAYQGYVPFWFILIVVSFYPLYYFVGNPIRRSWHRKRGLCQHCGYDLTGNVSGVCPECGERI
jgi:hypothetical protein